MRNTYAITQVMPRGAERVSPSLFPHTSPCQPMRGRGETMSGCQAGMWRRHATCRADTRRGGPSPCQLLRGGNIVRRTQQRRPMLTGAAPR